MTGVIGLVLILFGLRSLYRYKRKQKSLKRSRLWADAVVDWLQSEISKPHYK